MAELKIVSVNKKSKHTDSSAPEIAKPITWQFLKDICMTNLNGLYYKRKELAAPGLNLLEKEIKKLFPYMIDTCFVAKRSDWETAYKNYRKVRTAIRKDKSIPEIVHDAHFRIECVMDTFHRADMELEDAFDETCLTELQALACFNKWLVKNKWKNVQLPLEYGKPYQSIAQKRGRKMITVAIDSFDRLYTSPEMRTGEALVKLFKLKAKERNAQVALAVPGDLETRKHFMPFTPFILKTGIRIFMVKAPDKAVEIKK